MSTILSREFGKTKAGQKVTAYELCNKNGVKVTILDFGGTVQSFLVPDKNGKMTDVVLGYDDVRSYEEGTCYYGGIVGRFANRIGKAEFELEGKKYSLEKKGEDNHVHGIYNKKMFESSLEGEQLVLRLFSPDGEEGYPGNLNLEVRYRLSEDNALEINYRAECDAPTIVNFTNHSYFNLNGQDGSTVLNHRLQLNCYAFTEYTESFAQTGRIIDVENTPLDFRKEQIIGSRIEDDYHQLKICTGYDHNMILEGEEGELKKIGTLTNDATGISLEAFTTEPAIQCYTGNYMHFDSASHGKNGIRYPRQGGFCMEAQHYPDSPNHPNFPNTVLRPGETYTQTTIYRFK